MSQENTPASATTVTQDLEGEASDHSYTCGKEGLNHSMDITIALELHGYPSEEEQRSMERPLLLPSIRQAHEAGYNGPVLPLTWDDECTSPLSQNTQGSSEMAGKELGTALLPEELIINLPEWPSLTNILYARLHLTPQLSSEEDHVQIAAEKVGLPASLSFLSFFSFFFLPSSSLIPHAQ